MARFPLPTGKKNKLRVYYLSWLRNRILHNDPEVEKKQGWITVGDLEGCIHYKVGEWLGPPCWAGVSGKMAGGIFCVTTAVKIASGRFALALRRCVVSIALSLERVMLTGCGGLVACPTALGIGSSIIAYMIKWLVKNLLLYLISRVPHMLQAKDTWSLGDV